MESKGQETVVLRQDSFKISGNDVTVILTDHGIEWNGDGKSRKGSIEWADILNVTPIPAGCRKPKGPGATLHYISKPNKVWKQASVTFTALEEQGATAWVERVNGLMMEKVPQRPRRLLVIVNPKSGASKGVKIYESKAAPVFKVAGINTDVTVTERAQHAVEIIKNADLSRYDGVVAVGGDGTLTECLAGLAARARLEAGIDPDDPDSVLPFLDTRVGLIPAGTGQGMVVTATGSKGVENACLHIIYGEVWDMDLFTTHSGRHLLYTSCLLAGYGFFGEAIRISESNRQLGRMRYPYAMAKAAANVRRFKVNVDILVQGTDGKPPEWISRHGVEYVNVFHMMYNANQTKIYNGVLHLCLEKSASGLKPAIFFAKVIMPGHVWISRHDVEYVALFHFMFNPHHTKSYNGVLHLHLEKSASGLKPAIYFVKLLMPGHVCTPLSVVDWITRHGVEYVCVFHLMYNPHQTRIYNGVLHLYLEKSASGLKPAIFFAKVIMPGHVEIPPFIEYFEALSYKITPCTTEDGGSPEGAAASPAGNMPFDTMNIDGEMFKLQAPEITFKVHPKTVRMFGAHFKPFLAEQVRKEEAAGHASGSSG